MVDNLVIINEAICYKIYSKADAISAPYKDAKELNVHHLHIISYKNAEAANGFLKHVRKIEPPVNFDTHSIVFFIDYTVLPEISPPIHDPEESID